MKKKIEFHDVPDKAFFVMISYVGQSILCQKLDEEHYYVVAIDGKLVGYMKNKLIGIIDRIMKDYQTIDY